MKWDTSKRLQVEFIIPAKEVDEKKYFEMLEVLPPQAMASNAFLVGEPVTHNAEGLPVYDFYFFKEVNNEKKYFYGGSTAEQNFALFLIPNEVK